MFLGLILSEAQGLFLVVSRSLAGSSCPWRRPRPHVGGELRGDSAGLTYQARPRREPAAGRAVSSGASGARPGAGAQGTGRGVSMRRGLLVASPRNALECSRKNDGEGCLGKEQAPVV